MKRFLILSFILVLFGSCSLDNDSQIPKWEVLPIENVDIPDSFTLGEVYPITVTYVRPSTCHLFKEFYYVKENNIRTVAVVDYKFIKSDCEDLDNDLEEATFDFHVTSNGSYIFKFWLGEDSNGDDLFYTKEVPVTD